MAAVFMLADDVHRLNALCFAAPATHVYNPLVYAREPHEAYLDRFGRKPREIILLGMNPGPWGMVQTGVPFGEVGMVRGWLDISGRVEQPERPHPKRPVLGFACRRREVSGARLWGWARDTHQSPERFFRRFFVTNYCPLAFFDDAGRNVTPDKLERDDRGKLYAACDQNLRKLVERLRPRMVIGVGAFAETRARMALVEACPQGTAPTLSVARIPHPSPASPTANRGWATAVNAALLRLGV